MNVVNSKKCCHKSTGFGIGNTFCQNIIIVFAIVLTSTIDIPGILQRWQWHNGPQIGIMRSRGCTTDSSNVWGTFTLHHKAI